MTVNHTPQQNKIFDEVPKLDKDCAVIARAGSGKTYTLTRTAGMTRGKRCLLAFDKEASVELAKRYRGESKDCRTFHSWGLAGIKEKSPWCVVDAKGSKVERFLNTEAPDLDRHHYLLKKVIGYTQDTMCDPHRMLEYELAPDYDDEELAEIVEECTEVVKEYLHYSMDNLDIVDYHDMNYIPAKHPTVKPPSCDVLFIDESQDVNKCQHIFTERMKCRKVWIGDPCQAIYGWRGASAEYLAAAASKSMYSLTVTFRCGKSIVNECKRMVPDFEALPTQHVGKVLNTMSLEGIAPGDFLLARSNAQLVPLALSLASEGQKCVIIGKGLGGATKKLLRKMGCDNISDLRKAIADHIDEVRARDIADSVKASMIEIAQIVDYASSAVPSIGMIPDLLKLMFSPKADESVIRLSTVHKAKGKEADNVYVLDGSLSERSDEERNIKYVAYSRARHTLVKYHQPDTAGDFVV